MLLSLISCSKLFTTSGFVLREDWMTPLTWRQLCRALELYSYPWHSQLLGGWANISFTNMLFVMASTAPLTAIFGPMMATKIWVFLILFLSGASMYWLSSILIESKPARFTAALLYMYNPWLLERILSGHQFILLAYVSAPISLGGFILCLRTHKPNDVLLAGLAFAFTMVVDMHLVGSMVFILIILYLLYFLIAETIGHGGKRTLIAHTIGRSLTSFFIALCIGLLLNAFWILPYSIYVFSAGELFPFPPSLEDVYLFSSRGSLLMQGYFADHTGRIVESALDSNLTYLWYSSGFIISATAFSATFITSEKRKFALFFNLVAAFGIFMGMGSNQPLGFLYVWLFKNVPFFISFRNPSGFVFLVVISYSLLLAIVVSAFGQKSIGVISRGAKILSRLKTLSRLPKLNADAFLASAMCVLIFGYSFAMLTGDFAGQLKPLKIPEYYSQIDGFLNEQKDDYRVLLLHPYPGPLYDFVPKDYYYIQDPLVHFSPRSVITLGEGGPTNDFVRFMVFCLYNNRTEFVGKIMGLLGIRFIIVRNDMVYPPLWAGLNTSTVTQHILPRMKGINLVRSLGNVSIFENNYSCPRVFGSKILPLVAGDRRVLVSLASIEEVRLDLLPLVFLQLTDDFEDLVTRSDLIIIQNDGADDLLFASAKQTDNVLMIDPGRFVGSSSNFNTGWVSSRFVTQALRDPDGLFEIPGSEIEDWVVTKADQAKLDISFNTSEEGSYDLWVKLHSGPIRVKNWYAPQGSLSATIDGTVISDDIQPIKDYESDSNTANFVWKHVGEHFLSPGVHTLSLINKAHTQWGGLNFVSKIYIGPIINSNVINTNGSELFHILEAEDTFDIVKNGWRISSKHGAQASFGLYLESYSESGFDLFSTTTNFQIIKQDTYVFSIRLASSSGCTLSVFIDDHQFNLNLEPTEQFKRYEVGPLDLDVGYHDVSLTTDREIEFDNILFYNNKAKCTPSEFLNKICDEQLFANYSKINPTMYEVDFEDDTKMLVFLETTHPLWQSHGTSFGPSCTVFSYANGFAVYSSEQDRHTIIEYLPHRYEMVGVLLSSLTAVFSISVWVFFRRKRKAEGAN